MCTMQYFYKNLPAKTDFFIWHFSHSLTPMFYVILKMKMLSRYIMFVKNKGSIFTLVNITFILLWYQVKYAYSMRHGKKPKNQTDK